MTNLTNNQKVFFNNIIGALLTDFSFFKGFRPSDIKLEVALVPNKMEHIIRVYWVFENQGYLVEIQENELGPARVYDFVVEFKKEIQEKHPELLL